MPCLAADQAMPRRPSAYVFSMYIYREVAGISTWARRGPPRLSMALMVLGVNILNAHRMWKELRA